MSSGESDRESALLDASENGNDVFFLSSAPLTSQVHESGLNVFDARVCEAPGAEPCAQEPPPPAPPCSGEEACKPPAPGPQSFESAASSVTGQSGNVHVLGTTTTKPPTTKPPPKPTKAQLLSKALKACHKLKSKKKRVACEKSAHKRYGPFKASKAKRHSTAKSQVHR